MSFYKFKRNDVFTNTLKLYPEVKFVIYSGSAFYNNTPNISGAYADPIRLTDAGNVSLYELNVDRVFTRTGRTIGPDGIDDRAIIYPWIVKDGSRLNFGILSGYPKTAGLIRSPLQAYGVTVAPDFVSGE